MGSVSGAQHYGVQNPAMGPALSAQRWFLQRKKAQLTMHLPAQWSAARVQDHPWGHHLGPMGSALVTDGGT